MEARLGVRLGSLGVEALEGRMGEEYGSVGVEVKVLR